MTLKRIQGYTVSSPGLDSYSSSSFLFLISQNILTMLDLAFHTMNAFPTSGFRAFAFFIIAFASLHGVLGAPPATGSTPEGHTPKSTRIGVGIGFGLVTFVLVFCGVWKCWKWLKE